MSIHDHPMLAAIHEAWPGSRVIYQERERHALTDPNQAELAAMDIAGQRGGEYVESIGSTDFATWTPLQWQIFVATICGGYVDALVDFRAQSTEAMGKVSGQ